MVKENCGVVGIYSEGDVNVIPMVIDALRALQHRGQEAWGLAIPNKAPLKRLGLVSASSGEFKKISEESKIQYVSDKCIKQEYQKIFEKSNPVFPVLRN